MAAKRDGTDAPQAPKRTCNSGHGTSTSETWLHWSLITASNRRSQVTDETPQRPARFCSFSLPCFKHFLKNVFISNEEKAGYRNPVLREAKTSSSIMEQWFSECGPRTGGVSLPWGLVRTCVFSDPAPDLRQGLGHQPWPGRRFQQPSGEVGAWRSLTTTAVEGEPVGVLLGNVQCGISAPQSSFLWLPGIIPRGQAHLDASSWVALPLGSSPPDCSLVP